MNDDRDEIAEFFDKLTVADFLSDRDGAMRFALNSIPQGMDFDSFFIGNLHTLRLSYLASHGVINPLAMLCNKTDMFVYQPTSDEEMGQYIKRLTAEARDIRAKWLFISRVTTVATQSVDAGPVPSPNDPVAMSKARAAGGARKGVVYYAECIDEGDREIRFGMMQEDEGWRLSEPVPGDPAYQEYPLFANILTLDA